MVAMTAGGANTQAQLDAIWTNLLPARQRQALPDDASGQAGVKEVISHLEVHPAKK